jgi:magnesium transporter
MANISFYLSRILGNRVYSIDKKVIGKLIDVNITEDIKNPRVMSLKLKVNNGVIYIDAKNVNVHEEKGQYVIICDSDRAINKAENTFSLVKYILDKQIIDINGRKVVRVNDIKLASLNGGMFALAVDIGMDGLLRRLGMAKPLKRLLNNFNKEISNKLLLWDNVETLLPSNDNIVLSKSYERLSTLHPSDLADILEDFDSKTAAEIFLKLDNSRAADVLEEMETDKQVDMLKTIDVEKAADILEEMPPDEVADILDDLDKEDAEELLNSMEKEASIEVRELMEYEDNTVGSLMSTDFISLKNNYTAQKAIDYLRELKPEEENIYYLYVTNNHDKLCGVVSLRNLIISEPHTMLSEIMHDNLTFVHANDEIKELIKTVSKYNLLAIPVVDDDMTLIGMVVLNDVIYELIKGRRK